MIAGRRPQVLIGGRVIDDLELAEEPVFEVGRDVPRPRILDEERAQPLIPKAHDHAAARCCVYVPLSGTQCNCDLHGSLRPGEMAGASSSVMTTKLFFSARWQRFG